MTAATLLSGVVTFAAVSVVTGFGLGWVHQVGSSARLVNWLSLPTDVAIFADVVTGTCGRRQSSGRSDAALAHGRV